MTKGNIHILQIVEASMAVHNVNIFPGYGAMVISACNWAEEDQKGTSTLI